MEFAAIALGIGIDTACTRQTMPMVSYAYADEIYWLKIPKKQRRLA